MNTDKEKIGYGYNEFRRPRYFHGMLLDDQDFLAEQSYHAQKRRMLNRMLHGTGVVCGLGVSVDKTGCVIKIEPGLALDCGGNEIWVEKQIDVKISDLLPKYAPKAKSDCSSSPDDKKSSKTHFLGIYYHEQKVDPKSVYVQGGGCEDRSCDYSRTREGYCLTLVDCGEPRPHPGLLKQFCGCKETTPEERRTDSTDDKKTKEPADCIDCQGLEKKALCRCLTLKDFCKESVPCPDCGCCGKRHAVILGSIELDDKGNVTKLCINDCRRYVLTGRMVQHLITSTLGGISDAVALKVGGTDVKVKDGTDISRNPIEALCWMFRDIVLRVMEGAEVQWKFCPEAPKDDSKTSEKKPQS